MQGNYCKFCQPDERRAWRLGVALVWLWVTLPSDANPVQKDPHNPVISAGKRPQRFLPGAGMLELRSSAALPALLIGLGGRFLVGLLQLEVFLVGIALFAGLALFVSG